MGWGVLTWRVWGGVAESGGSGVRGVTFGGSKASGFGFRVPNSGFGLGSGFRIWFGVRIQDLGECFQASGSGLEGRGLRCGA